MKYFLAHNVYTLNPGGTRSGNDRMFGQKIGFQNWTLTVLGNFGVFFPNLAPLQCTFSTLDVHYETIFALGGFTPVGENLLVFQQSSIKFD